jgi:hypothetical protein
MFMTRLLLFGILGLITLLIGYPVSKVMRPKPNLIEMFIIGCWTIILLVFVMGLFKISFKGYVVPTVIFSLFASVIFLRKDWLNSFKWKTDRGVYLLLLLSSFAIVTRLIQVRLLLVPNWLDGLTHYGITYNILARGFVPANRIYHTGFHALASYISVLLPMFSLSEVMLMLGQWLCFLAGLSLFLLAQRINADTSIALISAILLWFFTSFPSYLISWSRYPLLAGIVFFPLSYIALDDWMQDRTKDKQFVFVLFSGAALFLTHYYLFFVWLCCLLLMLFVQKSMYIKSWQWLSFCIVISLLMATRLAAVVSHLGDVSVKSLTDILDLYEVSHTLNLMLKNQGWIVALLAVLGIVSLQGAQRKWLLWIGVVFSLGASFELAQNLVSETRPNGIQNSLILLTLPLVYSAALGVVFLDKSVKKVLGSYAQCTLYLFCALAISLSAYNNSVHLINQSTILFGKADWDAMQWIITNTSRYDTIAVATNLWGEKAHICDGGGWIQYLTARPTIKIDASFDPDHSDANYIYKGTCLDPSKDFVSTSDNYVRVFKNNDVEIIQLIR